MDRGWAGEVEVKPLTIRTILSSLLHESPRTYRMPLPVHSHAGRTAGDLMMDWMLRSRRAAQPPTHQYKTILCLWEHPIQFSYPPTLTRTTNKTTIPFPSSNNREDQDQTLPPSYQESVLPSQRLPSALPTVSLYVPSVPSRSNSFHERERELKPSLNPPDGRSPTRRSSSDPPWRDMLSSK